MLCIFLGICCIIKKGKNTCCCYLKVFSMSVYNLLTRFCKCCEFCCFSIWSRRLFTLGVGEKIDCSAPLWEQQVFWCRWLAQPREVDWLSMHVHSEWTSASAPRSTTWPCGQTTSRPVPPKTTTMTLTWVCFFVAHGGRCPPNKIWYPAWTTCYYQGNRFESVKNRTTVFTTILKLKGLDKHIVYCQI